MMALLSAGLQRQGLVFGPSCRQHDYQTQIGLRFLLPLCSYQSYQDYHSRLHPAATRRSPPTPGQHIRTRRRLLFPSAALGFTAEPRIGVERVAKVLLREAASLLVYHSVMLGPPAQAFLSLLVQLHRSDDGIKIMEAYGEFFRSLSAGDHPSWEDYVLDCILAGENNLFAEAAAGGAGPPATHLQAAAAADLDCLQRLSVTEATLTSWVAEVVDIRPEWRAAASRNIPPSRGNGGQLSGKGGGPTGFGRDGEWTGRADGAGGQRRTKEWSPSSSRLYFRLGLEFDPEDDDEDETGGQRTGECNSDCDNGAGATDPPKAGPANQHPGAPPTSRTPGSEASTGGEGGQGAEGGMGPGRLDLRRTVLNQCLSADQDVGDGREEKDEAASWATWSEEEDYTPAGLQRRQEHWRRRVGGLWRWAEAVPVLAEYYRRYGLGEVGKATALDWKGGHLHNQAPRPAPGSPPMTPIAPLPPPPILDCHRVARLALEGSLRRHLDGLPAFHVLLYGPSGMGKTELLRHMTSALAASHGLRCVWVSRAELNTLDLLADRLRKLPHLRFVVILDDLSFRTVGDDSLLALKALMEPSLQLWPPNAIICATSPRRDLMRTAAAAGADDTGRRKFGQLGTGGALGQLFGCAVCIPELEEEDYLTCVRQLEAWKEATLAARGLQMKLMTPAGDGGGEVDDVLTGPQGWADLRHSMTVLTAAQYVDLSVAVLPAEEG